MFPSSEKKKKVSSHPSHDLEQLYKHPSFDYTWSYKKEKKKNQTGHTPDGNMLGFLLSKNGSLSKKKKQNKKKYITGAGKQKQYKCLSHCYCGMSMGLRVVGKVVMTGGETTSIWTKPTLAHPARDR